MVNSDNIDLSNTTSTTSCIIDLSKNYPCKYCVYYKTDPTLFVNDGKPFCTNWHCIMSHAIDNRIRDKFQYGDDCFSPAKEYWNLFK